MKIRLNFFFNFFRYNGLSKTINAKVLDKNTLNLIWIAIIVSMTSGGLLTVYWAAPIFNTNVLVYFGSVLIVIGMIIRFISIRTLGKFFTVNLAIHGDQSLIKTSKK